MNPKNPQKNKKNKRNRNQKFAIVYVYTVEERQRREERRTSKRRCRELNHWMHQLGENHRKFGEEEAQSNDWELGKVKESE